MTEDNLTEWKIGTIVRVTTSVGNQAWHYQGKILNISKTHITLDDYKEGQISIPLENAMIREVKKEVDENET